jgi:hypothetical protein
MLALQQHLGNRAAAQLIQLRPVPTVVAQALRSPGRPLDAATRARMEAQLGCDLGGVRLRTGAEAEKAARALNARAFAAGPDIVFADGQYQPATPAGRRLLAHELVHTLQPVPSGSSPRAVIRRQGAPNAAITCRSIFPYDAGERLTVNHLVNEVMLGMIARMNPQLGTLLRQMVERRATVTTATDDLFEATIEADTATAQHGARGAMVLRLAKTATGFDLEFFQVDAQGHRTPLQPLRGLTARRADGGIALSGDVEGLHVEFAVRPGGAPRETTLGVTHPLELRLLDIRSLRGTRAGSPAEHQAVESAAKETGGTRTFPRQRLRLAGGALWLGHDPVAPLLGVAWQMNFIPSERAGALAQIPVEVQLQYAPTADFLARVSSGVEASFSPLVPLNARIVAGLGAGSVHAEPGAADPTRRLLLGPTVGGALGYEHGWFRVDLRYEYLANLLAHAPNAHTLSVRLGGAF